VSKLIVVSNRLPVEPKSGIAATRFPLPPCPGVLSAVASAKVEVFNETGWDRVSLSRHSHALGVTTAEVRVRPSANIRAKHADVENKDSNGNRVPNSNAEPLTF